MSFLEIVRPSPNCAQDPVNARQGVLIHHTVMSYDATISYMLDPASRVSYHAIIAKSGERCQLVPDEHIAWHAGVSTFQGRDHCNFFLLGLAFEGDTYREPLTASQLESAFEWLGFRWAIYHLNPDVIVDHRQVAAGRKDDLNPAEWERFRQALVVWAAGAG